MNPWLFVNHFDSRSSLEETDMVPNGSVLVMLVPSGLSRSSMISRMIEETQTKQVVLWAEGGMECVGPLVG